MSLKLKNYTQTTLTLKSLCGEPAIASKPIHRVTYRKIPNDVQSCNIERYNVNGDSTVDITARSPSEEGAISIDNRQSCSEYTVYRITKSLEAYHG